MGKGSVWKVLAVLALVAILVVPLVNWDSVAPKVNRDFRPVITAVLNNIKVVVNWDSIKLAVNWDSIKEAVNWDSSRWRV